MWIGKVRIIRLFNQCCNVNYMAMQHVATCNEKSSVVLLHSFAIRTQHSVQHFAFSNAKSNAKSNVKLITSSSCFTCCERRKSQEKMASQLQYIKRKENGPKMKWTF